MDDLPFWAKVDRTAGPDACWPWTGKCNSGKYNGYGVLQRGKKLISAHRYAMTLTGGLIPTGMHVLHSCDNPPCCNPAHLRLGSHADNMHDMFAKGRRRNTAVGERQGKAVLTDEAVREIRRTHSPYRVTAPALARRFGVSVRVIHRVIRGDSWRHVA